MMRQIEVEKVDYVRVKHTGRICKIESKDGLYRSGLIELVAPDLEMPLYHDPYDLESSTEKEYLMQQLS